MINDKNFESHPLDSIILVTENEVKMTILNLALVCCDILVKLQKSALTSK